MIVFDLDGVLVNPSKALAAAWSRVNVEFGLGIDVETYRSWVGIPLSDVLLRFDGATAKSAEIRDVFEEEMSNLVDIVAPYPQVIEGVKELVEHGAELAVFTSKPRFRALHACEGIGLGNAVVVSPEDLTQSGAKPSPEGLFKIASMKNIQPSNISFLGDSPFDLAAARGAGVRFLHARWGFHALEQDINGFASFTGFGDFVRFAKIEGL